MQSPALCVVSPPPFLLSRQLKSSQLHFTGMLSLSFSFSPLSHFPLLSFSLSPLWQINRSHVSSSCTPSACSSERTPPCLASVATWAALWLAQAEKLQREEPRVADRHSVSETKTQGVLPAAVPQGWGLEMENTDWVPGWLLDKSVWRVSLQHTLHLFCKHVVTTCWTLSKRRWLHPLKFRHFPFDRQPTYYIA